MEHRLVSTDSHFKPTFSVTATRPSASLDYDVHPRQILAPAPQASNWAQPPALQPEELKQTHALQRTDAASTSLAFVKSNDPVNLAQLLATRGRGSVFVLPSMPCRPVSIKDRIVSKLAELINAMEHSERVNTQRKAIRDRNSRIVEYRNKLATEGSDPLLANVIEYVIHSLKRLCLLDPELASFAPNPAAIDVAVEILSDSSGFSAVASGYDIAFITEKMLTSLEQSCNAQLAPMHAYTCKVSLLRNKFIKLEVKTPMEAEIES